MRSGGIAIVAGCAALAAAAEYPHEAKKFVLKQRPAGSSLVWVARVPPVALPAATPVAAGATLVVTAQGGETGTFALPAAGWTAGATVLRFENAAAPGGISAVKAAVLRNAKVLKIVARTSGVSLDEPAQGAVSISLTVGDDVYCSTCATPVRDAPGRFVAKRCPAPASCAATPVTTSTSTSTSTSSTTFVPGLCGNGLVDPPSEHCDGTDPGVCDDVVPSFPVTCDAPGSPTPCQCCSPSQCVFFLGGSTLCCGGGQCQDVVGAGMVRSGVCIPPSCTGDTECHGYACVDGSCCGQAGELCGVVGCCSDSGATCTFVPGFGVRLCCRPPGGTCAAFNECCSGACTDGVCD